MFRERGWESGSATIVAKRFVTSATNYGGYEFVGDVSPDSGGPPFRAIFKESMPAGPPEVGQQARVKFHPKSQKVKLDRSALRAQKQALTAESEKKFEAIASPKILGES